MFSWTPKTIAWYNAAAKASHYHRDLALLLMQDIDEQETVGDIGCGLGYLSLELAQKCRNVVAVDIDVNALSALYKQQKDNINVICADAKALPPDLFVDTAVLCFFGRISENDNLDKYLAICKRRLICVVSNSSYSAASQTGKSFMRKERPFEIETYLNNRQKAYKKYEAEFEFGQPFDTFTEAVEYIRYHSNDCDEAVAAAHANAHLQQLPNGGYYLPYCKKVAIFIIEKQEEIK
ncbi:MAG: class I SAM-dependent methyltransferase [Oscillospiraceae bacterium]